MRRFLLSGLLFLLMLCLCIPATANELLDQAVKQVSKAALAALPADAHVRLIAITEIKGDDGRITRNLTEALQASSHYILVERTQLEALIKEQGFQLSDLASRDHRIEHGQIKGVEGIIFGKVLKDTSTPLSASFKLFLQMDNVQTGDILMAKEFSTTVYAPYRNKVIGFAIIAMILFFMSRVLRSRARTKAIARHETAGKGRMNITDDLTRISKTLDQAQMVAAEKNASTISSDLSGLVFETGTIRDRISSGRWGQGMGKDTKQLAKQDRQLSKSVQTAGQISDQILKIARKGELAALTQLIADLKQQMSAISAEINQRT